MKEISLLDEIMNSEANFIPLFSLEDEKKIRDEQVPEDIAILPLRNTLLFPVW